MTKIVVPGTPDETKPAASTEPSHLPSYGEVLLEELADMEAEEARMKPEALDGSR